MQISRTGILAAALLCLPLAAAAAVANSAFQLTVRVAHSCKVETVKDVLFGDYSPSDGNTAVGVLGVKCTLNSKYSVALSNGSHGTGPTQRRMKHATGTDTLVYGLYQDENRSIPWGGTVGTDTRGGTGTGAKQTVSVYADLPAGQNVSAGPYSDLVIVTVSVDAVQ